MTGSDLFIADLHLCAAHAETARAFELFLAGPARVAGRLFILGDLFEYWPGDDDLDAPFNAKVCNQLALARQTGLEIYFLAGNRDFLIDGRFAERTGVALISEPHELALGQRTAIILHGDAMCTDDHDYQAFRAQVRSPEWQAEFLSQPLEARKKIIEGVRAQSEAGKREKPAAIMDVNAEAVADTFRALDCRLMIHGHTHRPATHRHEVDGRLCERWVLSDWHGTAPYLESIDGTLRRRELVPPPA